MNGADKAVTATGTTSAVVSFQQPPGVLDGKGPNTVAIDSILIGLDNSAGLAGTMTISFRDGITTLFTHVFYVGVERLNIPIEFPRGLTITGVGGNAPTAPNLFVSKGAGTTAMSLLVTYRFTHGAS